MKYIFLILIALPFTVFSQNQVELSSITIMKINEVVRNCLEDYEKESKVTRGNEDYFYELFSDNEVLVDDIIPSPNYGDEINSFDWVELMKGIKIYNIETEVLDWERYSPVSLDSGVVVVRVKKTVLSSMWSDKVRKEFNIVEEDGKDEIIQKVRYSSEEEFRFKFIYSLNSEEMICTISSIKKINELTSVKVYVPYKKALFSSHELMGTLIFEDSNLFASGDNISYFLSDEISKESLDDYNVVGYRTPKLPASDGNSIQKLVYHERVPISAVYSYLINNKSEVVQFGDLIIPSNIEFTESLNLSVSAILFSKNKLSFGLKVQKVMSAIEIEIASNQNVSQLDNPVSNYQNTYRRINTVTNFAETLDIDQTLVFATANYNIAEKLRLFAGINIFSLNAVTSNRSAHAEYSGMFEDFNIEITEPINYTINGDENILELGHKEWDLKENLELTQSTFSVFEIGGSLELPLDLSRLPKEPILSLYVVYKGTSESWFENSSNQISEDVNEINSFVSFSNNININGRWGLGLSISVKL